MVVPLLNADLVAEGWYDRPVKWKPFKDAPHDGRWFIAICNDRVTVHRISWGISQSGEVGWCEADRFLAYGDGPFAPHGGWIDCPQPGSF